MITFHVRMTLYAVILVTAGILICYLIGKRRFDRRNIAGLQQFKNYHTALFTVIIERLLYFTGWLMILAAVILYLIA